MAAPELALHGGGNDWARLTGLDTLSCGCCQPITTDAMQPEVAGTRVGRVVYWLDRPSDLVTKIRNFEMPILIGQ